MRVCVLLWENRGEERQKIVVFICKGASGIFGPKLISSLTISQMPSCWQPCLCIQRYSSGVCICCRYSRSSLSTFQPCLDVFSSGYHFKIGSSNSRCASRNAFSLVASVEYRLTSQTCVFSSAASPVRIGCCYRWCRCLSSSPGGYKPPQQPPRRSNN